MGGTQAFELSKHTHRPSTTPQEIGTHHALYPPTTYKSLLARKRRLLQQRETERGNRTAVWLQAKPRRGGSTARHGQHSMTKHEELSTKHGHTAPEKTTVSIPNRNVGTWGKNQRPPGKIIIPRSWMKRLSPTRNTPRHVGIYKVCLYVRTGCRRALFAYVAANPGGGGDRLLE